MMADGYPDDIRRGVVMVRTMVQLTDEQMDGLRALAAQRGVSIAELVRQGVDHVLRADKRAERLAHLRAMAGAFSGPPDLGRRHDDYLAEIYAEVGTAEDAEIDTDATR
jgi:hypothetical protein